MAIGLTFLAVALSVISAGTVPVLGFAAYAALMLGYMAVTGATGYFASRESAYRKIKLLWLKQKAVKRISSTGVIARSRMGEKALQSNVVDDHDDVVNKSQHREPLRHVEPAKQEDNSDDEKKTDSPHRP
jgi:hypothetical protein